MASPGGYGATARGGSFLTCPDCLLRGVHYCMTRGSDDLWICRYCQWNAYVNGNDALDVALRRKFAAVNPDAVISVRN